LTAGAWHAGLPEICHCSLLEGPSLAGRKKEEIWTVKRESKVVAAAAAAATAQ